MARVLVMGLKRIVYSRLSMNGAIKHCMSYSFIRLKLLTFHNEKNVGKMISKQSEKLIKIDTLKAALYCSCADCAYS